MNLPDPQADAVWQSTLPQIRATRRNRRNHRIAVGAAGCCALAIWLTLQRPAPPGMPTARTEPTHPKIETMAVMRVDENGTIHLEEIAANELGSFEFAFGQTPLLPSELTASEFFPEDSPWF